MRRNHSSCLNVSHSLAAEVILYESNYLSIPQIQCWFRQSLFVIIYALINCRHFHRLLFPRCCCGHTTLMILYPTSLLDEEKIDRDTQEQYCSVVSPAICLTQNFFGYLMSYSVIMHVEPQPFSHQVLLPEQKDVYTFLWYKQADITHVKTILW